MLPSATRRSSLPRFLAIAAIVFFCLLCGETVLLAIKWPFTREKTITSLERFSSSRVRAGAFNMTFFPHPGYVVEDLTFSRTAKAGSTRLASVHTLRCSGSWFAVISLTHRVSQLRIEGLHVEIPAPVPPPMRLHPSVSIETTVTQIVANGAVLDIAPRKPGGRMLRLQFRELTIGNVAKNKPVTLHVTMRNPEPPSDLAVTGTFGPFDTKHVNKTPLSGSFDLTHADLNYYRVIGGVLQCKGSFKGTLGHAEVRGQAAIPDFAVTSSHHDLGLTAEFDTLVDGQHGDVTIEKADAHFLHTNILAHGSIVDGPGQEGKTLALDVATGQARVEDLLRLFVKADRPPLDGAIAFRTHVTLPPGTQPFLRRVRLDGRFDIKRAEFVRENTQEKVNDLSERARGKKKHDSDPADADPVVSELNGDATVRNATAFLSHASFQVPGAKARGQGTYNLLTEAVAMSGTIAIETSLSKAAGGIKSVLLLPLDPFFKKAHAGAVIPIRVAGTYSHPVFKVSLTGKK